MADLYINKYAPTSLSEIVGNDSAVKLVQSLLYDGNCQNILLVGPSGCGKSTLVKQLVKEYFGEYYKEYFIEIYGSIDRSKDMVTEYKKKTDTCDNINLSRFINKTMKLPEGVFRIIVIYDFECISDKAQLALKGIIEEKSNRVRYIFVCSSVASIIEAIQSRCIPIIMYKIEDECIIKLLRYISTKNNKVYNENVYIKICELSEGDLKKALNYLQVFDNANTYDIDTFNRIFNNLPKDKLQNIFIDYSYSESINLIRDLISNGYNINDLLNVLLKILQDLNNKNILEFIKATIKTITNYTESQSEIHLYSLIGTYNLIKNT